MSAPPEWSSAEMRALVSAIPDALIVQREELIVFANPSFLRLVGAEGTEQVVGRGMTTFIHPSYVDAVRRQIAIDYELGVPSPPLELLLRRLDGSSVAVETIGVEVEWKGEPAIEVAIRDITARKQSEEVLFDYEKRIELASRAASMGVWEWDVEKDTVTWSDEIYRQFGYSRENFRGVADDFRARLHPDDRAQVEEMIARVKRGATLYDTQFRVVLDDGEVRWIKSHGIKKPNKNVMIGVAYDITELKNAQAKAEENEHNYRLLLDSTAEGIYGLDSDGLCTFCNRAAARMLGYDEPTQALGKRMHSVHHHHRADGTEFPVEQCPIYHAFQQGRGTHSDEEVFFRLNGDSFPCEYWSYPIVRSHVVVGSVATFLDITERKNAEARLRESEARYRSIVQQAPYGIAQSTLDGKILVVNAALARMLGYASEEDLMASKFASSLYERQEQRNELVAKLVETGAIAGMEVVWNRKDGKKIQVRLNAVLVAGAAGAEPVIQSFAEDITERKVLEKQFWHAQKMEAVGRLAGGIAHDFNNVLMVANSYADLILQADVEDERVRRYATAIMQSSMRAATVTRQLLAFSRRQMLEPESLNLNDVIADLTKILPKMVGENIEVLTKVAEIPRVLADRGQAEQVILNLAINARDAMPKGGRLTIETSAVSVDQSVAASMPPMRPGDYVCLTIADTGIGMDAQTKSQIFEPFFTTKERGKGTGLGLATVYGIVKQSDGFLFVDSEPGAGATFRIYLPAVTAVGEKSRPKTPVPEPVTQRGCETLLVVEDEQSLREAIVEYLASLGYTVLHAGSAPEAIRIAAAAAVVELVVTDLVLPGADGPDLARTLSTLHRGMKIIYMSGYSDRAVEGLGRGALLLKKPFGLADLGAAIRAVFHPVIPA